MEANLIGVVEMVYAVAHNVADMLRKARDLDAGLSSAHEKASQKTLLPQWFFFLQFFALFFLT